MKNKINNKKKGGDRQITIEKKTSFTVPYNEIKIIENEQVLLDNITKITKIAENINYSYLNEEDFKNIKSTSKTIEPDIDTYIKNKEITNKNLFDIISLSKYGIYDDNYINLKLHSKLKNKKTGGTLEELRKFSGIFDIDIRNSPEERLEELQQFITATNHYNESYEDTYGNSINSDVNKFKNTFIDKLINNTFVETDIDIYQANKNICDIIYKYKTKSEETEQMKLEVKRFYFDNNKISEKIGDKYKFIKKFEYYEYNKALILGYEIGLYYLKDNYQKFIDKQQDYLKNLHIINKKAINDYTKEIVSNCYIKPFNNDPQNFKVSTAYKNIGDAFAFFVCMFIINFINDPDKSYLYETETLGLIKDFFDKYNIDDLPYNTQRCHPLYDKISDEDWRLILNIYLDNLNQIILNAPELEEDLFVYRGANSNYLRTDVTTPTLKQLYKSTRIASYSINYEASKFFYKLAADNGIMFRVLLDKGTKALFITPFADINLDREMEILTADAQLLSVYESYPDYTDTLKITVESYNNINNTNCLSLNDNDKIKSHSFLHSVPFKVELPPPKAPIYISKYKTTAYREHYINQLPYNLSNTDSINSLIKLPEKTPMERPPLPPPRRPPVPP